MSAGFFWKRGRLYSVSIIALKARATCFDVTGHGDVSVSDVFL